MNYRIGSFIEPFECSKGRKLVASKLLCPALPKPRRLEWAKVLKKTRHSCSDFDGLRTDAL